MISFVRSETSPSTSPWEISGHQVRASCRNRLRHVFLLLQLCREHVSLLQDLRRGRSRIRLKIPSPGSSCSSPAPTTPMRSERSQHLIDLFLNQKPWKEGLFYYNGQKLEKAFTITFRYLVDSFIQNDFILGKQYYVLYKFRDEHLVCSFKSLI